MSVDPTTGAVGGTADVAALVDAELAQLAADGAALRAMLVEDAVVTARVLPSNGLTDLLEIAGRRVAAALPPTVRPGDVLQVRVNGFDGDRILVQIVATGTAAAGPAPPGVAPQPGIFVPGSIVPATPATPPTPPTTTAPAPAAGEQPAAGATAATSTTGPSAVPGAGAAEVIVPEIPIGNAPRGFGPSIVGVSSTPAGLPRATGVPPAQPSPIEARVAANAAAPSRTTVPFARSTAVPDAPPANAASVAAPTDAAAARPAPAAPALRFAVPPQIAPKSTPVLGGATDAIANAAVAAAADTTPSAAVGAPRATGLSAYTQPVALLRALRLPVTPSNVASATLALQHPDRLPAALAALEGALPRASADPNVATLKTLLGFVGRIDPGSPALAAQVAAYVDHVVDGAEPKFATLLAAARATGDAAAPRSLAPPAAAHDAGASGKQHVAPPPIASAVVAERRAALASDLKQTLLAVAANAATPESVAPALSGALSALTAVQLTAAQTLAANPDGIAFTIPLTTQHGPASAHITVQREAPNERRAPLDGENFRIAFVLDTAHYGTVAIELVTVGREVTVDVRTEAAPAMRAFRDALGTLTARLESLRYRVASAGASLGTPGTIAVDAPPSSRPPDPDATVDRTA